MIRKINIYLIIFLVTYSINNINLRTESLALPEWKFSNNDSLKLKLKEFTIFATNKSYPLFLEINYIDYAISDFYLHQTIRVIPGKRYQASAQIFNINFSNTIYLKFGFREGNDFVWNSFGTSMASTGDNTTLTWLNLTTSGSNPEQNNYRYAKVGIQLNKSGSWPGAFLYIDNVNFVCLDNTNINLLQNGSFDLGEWKWPKQEEKPVDFYDIIPYPKVISAGDLNDTLVALSFKVKKVNSIISITVFNIIGEQVNILYRNHNLGTETEGKVFWDGMDQSGKKLPVGIYIIYMDIVEPDGNFERLKCTVVNGMRLR